MKLILSVLLCFSLQFSFAQKLDIVSLEKILFSSFTEADSLLKDSKFNLSDKETGEGYYNYYYTSLEKITRNKQLLRSVSLMDIYNSKDTSRLILYRTYEKNDQEEMKQQLLSNGYELSGRSGNDFVYKRKDMTVINKISEKKDIGHQAGNRL